MNLDSKSGPNPPQAIQFSFPGRKTPGRAAENQDRIFVRHLSATANLPEATLIGVTDGVSKCPFGGSVARYVETHLLRDEIRLTGRSLADSLPDFLSLLYCGFKEEFAEYPDMLDSACTVSVAVTTRDELVFGWLGDSPVFHLQPEQKAYRGELISLPDIDRNAVLVDCFGSRAPGKLKTKRVPARSGDIVVVASDGAGLDEYNLAETLSGWGFTDLWLRTVTEPMRKQRFFDDISMVAVRLP